MNPRWKVFRLHRLDAWVAHPVGKESHSVFFVSFKAAVQFADSRARAAR